MAKDWIPRFRTATICPQPSETWTILVAGVEVWLLNAENMKLQGYEIPPTKTLP